MFYSAYFGSRPKWELLRKPRHETMANESSTADPATVVAAADARYTFDVKKLEELRKSSPWRDDPRYFKGVAIGPSAVMKMVSR